MAERQTKKKRIFAIMNMVTVVAFGNYEADSEDEAFDLMAQRAGFATYAAMAAAKPEVCDQNMAISELDLEDDFDATAWLQTILDQEQMVFSRAEVKYTLMTVDLPSSDAAERLGAGLLQAGLAEKDVMTHEKSATLWRVEAQLWNAQPCVEYPSSLARLLSLILTARRLGPE